MNKASKQRVERALRQSKVLSRLSENKHRQEVLTSNKRYLQATFVRG